MNGNSAEPVVWVEMLRSMDLDESFHEDGTAAGPVSLRAGDVVGLERELADELIADGTVKEI